MTNSFIDSLIELFIWFFRKAPVQTTAGIAGGIFIPLIVLIWQIVCQCRGIDVDCLAGDGSRSNSGGDLRHNSWCAG